MVMSEHARVTSMLKNALYVTERAEKAIREYLEASVPGLLVTGVVVRRVSVGGRVFAGYVEVEGGGRLYFDYELRLYRVENKPVFSCVNCYEHGV